MRSAIAHTLRQRDQEDLRRLPAFLRSETKREWQVARGKVSARLSPPSTRRPPLFLVGCPRSGTTLLFDLLRRHEELCSLPDEGHVYWTAFNHPRRHGWESDSLDAAHASAAEKRYLETAFARLGTGRALDKTPKNVLRLPYLRALFPDAHIVLATRDGRATVASLLEGWRRRRGASYFMPKPLRLRDYDSRIWRYVLPPGWQDLQGTELAHVATHQYERCNEAGLRQQGLVDVVVRYEDIVANPVATLRDLTSKLGLAQSSAVLEAAHRSPQNLRGAISAPRGDKWRDVADDLAPYLSRIENQMSAWGYTHE